MKYITFVMALLIAGSASAISARKAKTVDLQSITICNPANKADRISVLVKDGQLTFSNITAGIENSQTSKIKNTIPATIQELRDIASNAKLQVNLEQGVAYQVADYGLLIAVDSQGVKHLFQLFGPYSQILSNETSCK